MSTNYPSSLDTFTNPSASDQVGVEVGGRTHSEFHADINDAVEALQAKVGADSSAVTTSHDYKLSSVATGEKAVSTSGNQSVAGVKTFSTSGGIVGTSAVLTTPKVITSVNDTNGNELIKVTATGSAVNEVTLANAATGNNPAISATGDDANIGIDINTKGTGTVNIKGNSTQAGEVRIYEDTDNGSNYTAIKAGSQSANISYTLPTTIGSAGQFLSDAAGNGTLSWASVGAAVTATVSLSSADILALHTTPITLVAAQGAGTVVVVDNVVFSLDAGTQYANGSALRVKYAGDTELLVNQGSNHVASSAVDAIWSVIPLSSSNGTDKNLSAGINADVQLDAGTAFITGTGTLKAFVTYHVITL